MAALSKDFKNELRKKANESLQRHFKKLEDETTATTPDPPSPESLASFTAHVRASKRILVLVGAGLSVASGISTYRSSGGFWRTYSSQQLATRRAFEEDPVTVWQFYNHFRRQAAKAQPNEAHFALAELAAKKPGLLSVNQNIDELCQRAGHPLDQIIDFHGTLFRVKCFDEACGYEAEDHDVPVEDETVPSDISIADLPHCPKCKVNLLRPATVWFGEGIPEERTRRVEQWLSAAEAQSDDPEVAEDTKIDLMLVVGTSAVVYPAAGYIIQARKQGARLAFFNMEVKSAGVARPELDDWVFLGDAAELVPLALRGPLEE